MAAICISNIRIFIFFTTHSIYKEEVVYSWDEEDGIVKNEIKTTMIEEM